MHLDNNFDVSNNAKTDNVLSQAVDHTQHLLADAWSDFKRADFHMLPWMGKGGPEEIIKGGLEPKGKIEVLGVNVSDKERNDAEKTLEKGFSKLIPEADRATMKAMTEAITHGDAKAFAEAVKNAGGDPKKLKALVEEVDKALEAKGCTTRLDVAADGSVIVSDMNKNTAVAVNPANGAISARGVEHNIDGSITLKPGEVLHVDTDGLFQQIGDSAVAGVNGVKLPTDILGFGLIPKEPTFKPFGGPFDPTGGLEPLAAPSNSHPDWMLLKAKGPFSLRQSYCA